MEFLYSTGSWFTCCMDVCSSFVQVYTVPLQRKLDKATTDIPSGRTERLFPSSYLSRLSEQIPVTTLRRPNSRGFRLQQDLQYWWIWSKNIVSTKRFKVAPTEESLMHNSSRSAVNPTHFLTAPENARWSALSSMCCESRWGKSFTFRVATSWRCYGFNWHFILLSSVRPADLAMSSNQLIAPRSKALLCDSASVKPDCHLRFRSRVFY